MSPTTIKTIILRFRDLVTDTGDTIATHQEKIEEYGDCWWGWWRKAGERIPRIEFAMLRGFASEQQPLCLFLFDSGTLRFYEADCVEIAWNQVDPKKNWSPLAATGRLSTTHEATLHGLGLPAWNQWQRRKCSTSILMSTLTISLKLVRTISRSFQINRYLQCEN